MRSNVQELCPEASRHSWPPYFLTRKASKRWMSGAVGVAGGLPQGAQDRRDLRDGRGLEGWLLRQYGSGMGQPWVPRR